MTNTAQPADPDVIAFRGMTVDTVPIDQLKHHPDNKRIGDVDTIRQGLRTYGQYRPAVVQRSTGYVVVGNHMMEAAIEEGWTHLSVHYVDLDDDQAKRLLFFDNRASDKGTYDNAGLLEALREMDDLAGTGYAPTDLDTLAKLTGELGRQRTSFLDGDDDPAGADEPPPDRDRQYFQLNYPVTEQQRKIVLDALKHRRDQDGLETSVDALVAICADEINRHEKTGG